ncbi:hypothetical protein NXW05_10200 [Phocaeicola vulgatus]|nr:hypothetical protein [Phocaeicola vulgatus]
MRTNEIQFGGKSYVCRIVEANDGEELLIAPTTLLDALRPCSFDDENEGFASKEAESIYDEVFYFTDEKSIQLPENELIAELKESNPDWFE